MGHAKVSLQIGDVKAVQKFLVVEGLFPIVTVGIRTMKTMGIEMDLRNDCIFVDGNVRIPFLCRITPESVEDLSEGKAKGPFLGATKSPQI
jgi:hypothetical protein